MAMKIFSSIGSILDRLCVVAGAFVGSQIPEFFQQYTQRLSGHVSELHRLLNQMRQVASYSNKTLEQYIHKFISSSDPDFVHQGEFMQGMVSRFDELNQALNYLMQSSMWLKPYVFAKGIQYDIAHATLSSFQPGINLNVEGFCYAVGGILVGWVFYQILSKSLFFGCTHAVSMLKLKPSV
jgi:hypothetical protein